jgi:Calcineurin-like phosphoesterase
MAGLASLVAVALYAFGLGLGAPQAAQPSTAVDGEYGLFVADDGDSVVVRWITGEPDVGVFRARVGSRVVHQGRTPKALAHRTAFRRPRGKLLTLIYGGAGRAGMDTTVVSLDRPTRPREVIREVDSVFVVSDIHGQFSTVTQVLSRAGVLDAALRWTGGRAHLVVVGDVFDRGPDATRVWWLLYRLEREARAAGGAVDVLLGNHEIMTLVGDTTYLSGKEALLARQHGTCYACLYDIRTSVLGRWLASKPAVLKINDAVFVHGGVTPLFAGMGIGRLNDAVYDYMREPIFPYLLADSVAMARFGTERYQQRLAFFFHPESPLWFRGYVQSDTLGAQLDSVLQRYDAAVHVVGHTPVRTIAPRYGGKLIPVNVVDFASELLLLTYSRDGKRQAYRVDSQGRSHGLRWSP